MNIGQEFSVQQVRDLLSDREIRRQGIDSINDALRNYSASTPINRLIPDDFRGVINFNLTHSDPPGVVYSEGFKSSGDGKFYYLGNRMGY